MRLSDIDKSVNEGIGQWSMNAAKAGARGIANFGKALPTAFGTAIGMDASRPAALKTQQSIAKSNFVGKFVQKMSGFIASTGEGIKDDVTKMQQQAQAQQTQASQAQAQQSQFAPRPVQLYSTRPKESIDFELMLNRVLNEDQATDQYIQQYAATIKQAITGYMSGNLGNLTGQVESASQQIAQNAVAKKDYSQILNNLGEAIFDSYYSQQRNQYVQSKPAANIPLSPTAQQVLTSMKKLEPEEQEAVIQKLKQHTI